ncbi:MAG: succinate dehydrogenase [Verrucomicrobia bacterium]|nr:succinate dehydrogenase [Verrucomicrobiota bacterium]
MTTQAISRAFVWRRLHSLMGLWLVLFLMEHLLTNSQAALLLGDNARGFVNAVNWLHNLPYLYVIELVLLGVPILIHLVWGIHYLFTSKPNSWPSDGTKPSLNYSRNHAYTWQRITSYILAVALIGHVVKFRFLEYPWSAGSTYFVRVTVDKGLYTVADRLGCTLYDAEAIAKEKEELQRRSGEQAFVDVAAKVQDSSSYDSQAAMLLTSAQKYEQKQKWVAMLEKKSIAKGEVIAATPDFGTATLLTVRDTFKSPIYVALYTIFVLAACFHAFNGLWTFLITWGIVLNMASQKWSVKVAVGLMLLVTFLGLAAVWGTYYLNLRT